MKIRETINKLKLNRKQLILAGAVALAGIGVFIALGQRGCSALGGGADEAKPEDQALALAIIDDTGIDPDDHCLDSMPDECAKLKINGLGGPLARVFNDSNYVHYAEAEQIGISPIKGHGQLVNPGQPLVRITTRPNYYVAELSHSYPYLIPLAADRLDEVSQRFRDSLDARGGGDYRLKVTSLLRTDNSVRRLRRVNAASVDSSVHRFGTTFDISYTRFMLNDTGGVYRTQEDLKNLLAEVLWAMRDEGKCYVKYERKSGCFHITARRNR